MIPKRLTTKSNGPGSGPNLDVGQQRLDRRATHVVCRCGVTRVSLGDSPFELGDH